MTQATHQQREKNIDKAMNIIPIVGVGRAIRTKERHAEAIAKVAKMLFVFPIIKSIKV